MKGFYKLLRSKEHNLLLEKYEKEYVKIVNDILKTGNEFYFTFDIGEYKSLLTIVYIIPFKQVTINIEMIQSDKLIHDIIFTLKKALEIYKKKAFIKEDFYILFTDSCLDLNIDLKESMIF